MNLEENTIWEITEKMPLSRLWMLSRSSQQPPERAPFKAFLIKWRFMWIKSII